MWDWKWRPWIVLSRAQERGEGPTLTDLEVLCRRLLEEKIIRTRGIVGSPDAAQELTINARGLIFWSR